MIDTFSKKQKYIWLTIAWGIIMLIFLGQMVLSSAQSEDETPVFWYVKYPLIAFTVGLVLIYIFLIPGYEMIVKREGWQRAFLFLIHGSLFTILNTLINFLVYGFFIDRLTRAWYSEIVVNFLVTDFHNVLKNYVIFIAVLYGLDFFKKREAEIILKKNLENQLNMVKLETLKAKLEPHFLFNTLNGVVSLIDENKKKAKRALVELSDLLRFSVDLDSKELISVKGEIELLKKYVSIEKVRHEEQLNIEFDIKNAGNQFFLPSMILQPIVENSIKHGFKGIKKPLTVIIEIDFSLKEIRIKNNGNKLTKNTKFGVGLNVVKQQLHIHFAEEASFEIFQEGEWVNNRIKINETT